MKKFLTNLLGFSILAFLMFAVIEVALLYRPNIYSYKRQYMEDHCKEIRVLLLGSSHIEEAVKPEMVGNGVFNLAISARTREYDAALAEMYVPRMDSLQAVVMPVDYTSFFFERQKANPNEKKAPESLVATCRCMHTKYMGTRIDPIWYWSEILNSKLNYMSRFWNNAKTLQECDSLGYVKLDISDRLADWEQRALPALLDESLPIDGDAYRQMWEIYETVAQLTQHKGARLVLVSPPVYKTYQETIHPIVLNDMRQFVQKLCKQYPNVEYYDFLYDTRFLPEDFNDSSHLTDTGAQKFSTILREIIGTSEQ